MGVDADRVRVFSGIHFDALLSGLLREFLRRQALCDEGRLAADRCLHAATIVPKLVSAALPVRLRNVPLRRGLIKPKPGRPHGDACTVTSEPARVCICSGRAQEPYQAWTARTSIKILVRRSGLGTV